MAMERVTVDHNGERLTLEVPEGTSDDAIKNYLSQQSAPKTAEVNAAPQALSAVRNTLVAPTSGYPSSAGAGYAPGPATKLAEQATRGGIRDVASIGKILYNEATPSMVGEALLHPVKALQDFGSAYVQGHPWANATLKEGVQGLTSGAKNIGGALARGLVAPESLLALPYQGAAYEQEKIRANPNAPEYANNPYAMVQRGQAQTQGQAGAMNQRAAIGQMNTAGNPMPGTPQFTALQQQYAPAQQAVNPAPAPQPAIGGPAAQQGVNFIDEIKKKYGGFFGQF